MNTFDSSIVHFLNGFSRKSENFDTVVAFIVENDFIKGGILFSVFWFFWFQRGSPDQLLQNRRRIIAGLISCIFAVFVGRLLALTLPYRTRPVFNDNLHFERPYDFASYGLDSWSSFPSDHAVMFFALATAIFLISKKIGIFAYLYVAALVCFPRIYLGFHYPTDILVGAVIGILITLLISLRKISDPVSSKVLQLAGRFPGLFYGFLFLLSFQICTMFYETRIILSVLIKLIRGTL